MKTLRRRHPTMGDIEKEPEEMVFKFGTPRQEIDEPLDEKSNGPDELSKKDISEKDKDRKDKRYFSAFKLIVGCLVFLGIIYIVDVLVSALVKQSLSETTSGIIEIIKTLLYTLSGYLFARKENGD